MFSCTFRLIFQYLSVCVCTCVFILGTPKPNCILETQFHKVWLNLQILMQRFSLRYGVAGSVSIFSKLSKSFSRHGWITDKTIHWTAWGIFFSSVDYKTAFVHQIKHWTISLFQTRGNVVCFALLEWKGNNNLKFWECNCLLKWENFLPNLAHVNDLHSSFQRDFSIKGNCKFPPTSW